LLNSKPLQKEKKICLVIPSLNVGGMERVMIELAEYFVSFDYIETHLIILVKSDWFYTVPSKLLVHEPEFIFNSKIRIISTLRTLLYLRRSIKNISPDAILSFGEMFNSFLLLAAVNLKFKIVVSDRSKPDKKWSTTHRILRRILYPQAFGIISQTNYSKVFLFNETKHNNIKVIPNPVKNFYDSSIERKNIVLYTGRLITTKRIDILINVFTQINNPTWELWIVGDGPERKKLEILAKSMCCKHQIKFFGLQKEILSFYSLASIFAFTSTSEGFPNVLLEAISSGLPCIAFDCIAGPADLIHDGINGYLIKEMDIPLFKSKLEQLMLNPELRAEFGLATKQIAKEYTIDKIGDSYLKFLLS
jgi:GalNAc-alpha-(1->4)-GalNAc-alpha-(1->3)-diNAcBac-PP-undecaprenol alpha-1,4-N-acetyl-D-galactosaminyltransferase